MKSFLPLIMVVLGMLAGLFAPQVTDAPAEARGEMSAKDGGYGPPPPSYP